MYRFTHFSLISLFVFLTLQLQSQTPAAANYEGGTGTLIDPYLISNLAQLKKLSETSSDWSYNFRLTVDIDATETSIWNDGDGFNPIGNETTKFTGSFDGQDYIISDIFIDTTKTLDDYGLFGHTDGAEIFDVHLHDVDILGMNSAGALIGYSENSTVTGCSSTGNVSAVYNYLGGLIGMADYTTVSKCWSSCSVDGIWILGGLAGLVRYSDISECYANGKVKATASAEAGGLIGAITNTDLTDSYSGSILDIGNYGGGLLSSSSSNSTVNRCISYGNIDYYNLIKVGALTGENKYSSTYMDSYFDNQTSGVSSAFGMDDNSQTVTGLNTSEFNDEASFNNFNFTSVWVIAKTDQFRPHLRYESISQVSFLPGANGTMEGKTYQYVVNGYNSEPVTAVPNEAYHFVEWTDDGDTHLSSENPFTVENVSGLTYIRPVFAINQYAVNFTVTEGGSLNGSTSQTIQHGTDATSIEAVPDEFYHFVEWQNANGDSITDVNPLTLLTIVQDSTLTAIFELDKRNVKFVALMDGEILGDTIQKISHGYNSLEVEAKPDEHYHFKEWQNALEEKITDDNPLVIENVVMDSTLYAVFEIDTHVINFVVEAHGELIGETSQTLNYGQNSNQVEVVANQNYHFVEWQNKNGDSITSENPLIITSIAGDSTLYAFIEPDIMNVQFKVDSNGIIDGDTLQLISYNTGTSVVEAVPDGGYKFVAWHDEENNVFSTENPLILNTVTEDLTLTAVFEAGVYSVTFIATTGGTIEGDTFQIVEYNGNSTAVEAIPDENYVFVEWQIADGYSFSQENQLVIAYIDGELVFTAIFQPLTSVDVDESLTFKFYPNPAMDVLFVEITKKLQTINIYNTSGVLCKTIQPLTGINKIDISTFEPGIYILECVANEGKVTKILTIQ